MRHSTVCFTKIFRAHIILVSFLPFSCHSVAAIKFSGTWLDNASDNIQLGTIVITENKFTIINKVSYSIAKVITSGKSAIDKISSVSKTPDPMGCGPSQKVTYIVVSPLKPPVGMKQAGIYFYYYGGPAAFNKNAR